MAKRGAKAQIQVDWIISFFIFLFYLAWFFIFIIPSITPKQPTTLLFNIIEPNFNQNCSWVVEKQPIAVYSNITAGYEPIILDFNKDWSTNNFGFINQNISSFYDGKLLFVAEINNGSNFFWLAHSNSTYSQPYYLLDLDARENSSAVSSQEFQAEFQNSSLSRVYYQGNYKINNTVLYINEAEAPLDSYSFNSSPVVGYYKITPQFMNHSTFVFTQNSRLYNYIVADNAFADDNLTLSLQLLNYTDYYSDNFFTAEIKHNETGCTNYSTHYLNLFNSEDAVSFIMGNTSQFRLCINNDSISLNVTFSLGNRTDYRIFFHPGNYTQQQNFTVPYTVSLGSVEQITGFSYSRITDFASINSSVLRDNWNIPARTDFAIIVENSTAKLLDYYSRQNITKTIYAKEYFAWCIDQYANLEKCKITLNVG